MVNKVFVLAPIAKNIEGVRDFGEIRYVFERQLQKANRLDMEEVVVSMADAFCDFEPSRDYFLPIGNSVLNCVAYRVLAEIYPNSVISFLFWESGTNRYHKYPFTLDRDAFFHHVDRKRATISKGKR